MIRKANKTDYDRLIQIWKSSVLATHNFLSQEYFLEIKANLPYYFDQVDLYLYEKEKNLIIGFLGVSDDMIEMLFIDNEFRKQGIGTFFIKYAVNTLNRYKVDVNTQNVQALNFYKKMGFEESGYSEIDSQGKNYPITKLTNQSKFI